MRKIYQPPSITINIQRLKRKIRVKTAAFPTLTKTRLLSSSWWFYRSRLALRWYLPSTLPRNCISVDLGPRQEVGRSSCTLSRGGKRGKGQKCMNCCEVPRSSTRQSGTMRSVTPFRVVGLKTTGDCWHCWKATRSTLYIFLRLYFSSLFFTRSVFFPPSADRNTPGEISRCSSNFLPTSRSEYARTLLTWK